MNKISKYDEFLLEKEFNSIVSEFFKIIEEVNLKKTGPNTYEWDFKKEKSKYQSNKDGLVNLITDFGDGALNKLRDFLKRLPKEKIKEYYVKIINKFRSLPDTIRKKLIVGVTGVFLTFVGLTYLLGPMDSSNQKVFASGLDIKQTEEILELVKNKKASFEEAQKIVKLAEAGYSDDRGDKGNYINVHGSKRFIGTNHGISAPILANYYKSIGIDRLITKEDMKKLSYKTALKIYKKDYWDRQHLGELSSQNVANIIYDGCVNQGIEGMKSVMRNALEENGVAINDTDVIFSKDILSKANKIEPTKLFNSIKKFRQERYKESGTFGEHGDGWMNRLNNIGYIPDNLSKDQV